jgi:VanZ family protein
MIEYGFLFFLVFRGLHSINHQSISLKDKLILSLLISIGYAISDEIHQTYSLFREGRLRDVVIDTVGITIMYIYIKNNLRLLKKFLWIKS